MKGSSRAWRRVHMTGGKYQLDHPDAGREESLSVSAGVDDIALYQYGMVYQQRQILPEKRLMLAILDDAVAEFRRYASPCDDKGQRNFREVEAWILDRDFNQLFSFENICAELGFDSDYLRWGLRRCKSS